MLKLSQLLLSAAIFLAPLTPVGAADVPLWKSDPFRVAPANTAEFIVYCGAHSEVCRVAVVKVNNDNSIEQMNGTQACTLPDPQDVSMMKAKRGEQAKKVFAWLTEHRSTLPPDPQDAIKQAFAALWPEGCKSNFFNKQN